MSTVSEIFNRLHDNGIKNKIVVLDIDETIGYFVELGIFCDALTDCAWNNDESMQYKHFNKLMDIYGEFLRPNILEVLHYLNLKKHTGECSGVFVYTNNNAPRAWVEHIIKYIESKLKEPLFDQIVAAFKVNGKIIEVGRTTHDKTYDDLLRCTKLPSNVEVCFLDDKFYEKMQHARVYYINVKPYIHQISVETIINRFLQSNLRSTISKEITLEQFCAGIKSHMQQFSKNYVEKNKLEQEVDIIITKKIMEHLKTFFLKKMKNKKKTLKIKRSNQKNKTSKNMNH